MAKAVKVAAAIGRRMISGELDLREEGATREQLLEAGKRLRTDVPHESHAELNLPKNRPSPVDIVLASNKGRVQELIPLRMGRMAASPFTFLRGAEACGDQNDLDQAALVEAIKSGRVKAVTGEEK